MEKRPFIYSIRISTGTAALLVIIVAAALSCSRSDRDLSNGTVNLELGDFKRARAHFQSVLDREPKSFDARLGLGKALLQEFSVLPGDSTLLMDCLTQLEAARTLKPGPETEKLLSVVWFKRAAALLARRDTLSALAALSRSTGYDPKAASPVNLAGILYFYRGETEKALTLFSLVMKIDSASASGYFNAGMVHWAAGNYALAFKFWYKAALRAPEDKEIVTWAAMAKKRMATKDSTE